MSALSVVIGGLFAIFLVLCIVQLLGANIPAANRKKPVEVFSENRFNTAPLPKRTTKEIEAQTSNLRKEWATYNGMTPPLKLLIRGQSYVSYRRIVRSQIDVIGQQNFERMLPLQKADFNRSIITYAYVGDWEGAQYANGNLMPFSPANLSLLISNDPYLEAFIVTEARRVSPPPWPTD